jgi:hypothetical protein
MTYATVTGYPLDIEDDEDEDAYVDRMIALCEPAALPAPGGVLRPGGSCTLCARAAAERLAWGGEKVCWDCFDGQLDLLILALRQVEGAVTGS